MHPAKKKKLISIFILIVFGGSSIAFALLSSLTPVQKQDQDPTQVEVDLNKLTYNQPLTTNEETAYMQNNIIVVKYFYSNNCDKCPTVSKIVDELYVNLLGSVLLEKINIDSYKEEAKALMIDSVPTVYIKGMSVKKLTIPSYEELFKDACSVFFTKPLGC